MTDISSLEHRSGLPDALRVLVTAYPREAWPAHDNFGQMVQFWLERHLMFRRLLDMLQNEAEARVDLKMDFEAYPPRLQRYASLFLNELHAHHSIEDSHYFPKLVALEADMARGFDLLDADHHVLDRSMSRFAEQANRVLTGGEVGHFRDEVAGFRRLLNRHLLDEEEVVVPVILKHGPPDMA